MNADIVLTPDLSTQCPLPVFFGRLAPVFPSPADDYIEERLDLDCHLLQPPAATFFVCVTGDFMIDEYPLLRPAGDVSVLRTG